MSEPRPPNTPCRSCQETYMRHNTCALWHIVDLNKTTGILREEIRAMRSRVAELEAALAEAKAGLVEISEIENEMNVGDWDEIEEAREVARQTLAAVALYNGGK